MGNNPDILDFYTTEKLYLNNPFCSHPSTARSGTLLFPDFHQLDYKKNLHDGLELRHGFVIIQNRGDAIDGFFFDVFSKETLNPLIFLENLEALLLFTNYFKKEAKSLIENIIKDNFNIQEVKGATFTAFNHSHPLSSKDPTIKHFLNAVTPLSHRERQCLQLFKQGRSAQATGAILGISKRTVESHFDRMKHKLGCYSKSELLEW